MDNDDLEKYQLQKEAKRGIAFGFGFTFMFISMLLIYDAVSAILTAIF